MEPAYSYPKLGAASGSLPGRAQCELQNAWIVGAGDLHEVPAGLGACRQIQIHAIERIECLEPERYGNSFGDGKIFRQTQIHVRIAWTFECITAQGAKSPERVGR